MGIALIKIKIMPESPNTDLAKIESISKEKIEAESGRVQNSEEEPIAFGLKALIATLEWPEEKDTDVAEKIFREIEGVSSIDIIDYRRAL